MTVSVIFTVYNRAGHLAAALRALAFSRRPVDDVVVSDDGSSPEEAERMRSAFADCPFPVRAVRQEDRGYRLAAARNNALRAVRGDYVISLDGDILLLPDTVEAHLAQARRGRFLAGNRALAGEADTRDLLARALTPEGLESLWARADRRHLPCVQRQFQRNVWLRRVGLAKRHKPKILGCHFSAFREDIERINGFDERYEGWGLEDDDFSLRLQAAGVRGRSVIREARALHLWHAPVASHPGSAAPSRNLAYFRRRVVPAFCACGMRPAGPPA